MCLLMRWGQLSSKVHSNNAVCTRHKLEHRKLLLDAWKTIFTIRVVKYGNRLPRSYVESTSLKILKAHLVKAPSSLLWLDVHWIGMLQNGLQGSFQFNLSYRTEFCMQAAVT